MFKFFIIFALTFLTDRNCNPINTHSECASVKQLSSEINTEFIMLAEQFKPIKGYEGRYEVSNLGRVKSLSQTWITYRGGKQSKGETILAQAKDGFGYLVVCLRNSNSTRTTRIHHLVWDHFGDKPRNGRVLQVDHIDNNKQNNHIDNLQLLNNRENVSKGCLLKHKSSKYTGVSYDKVYNKWVARIRMGNINKNLGRYDSEIDAALVYLLFADSYKG